ncbi:MAG TPA: right-handed parallel beta-helix repeat-containing protein, partial [Luteolibacter sp.]
MKITAHLTLSLASLFTAAAIAAPAAIYVDPVNGKDTNSGTAADQAFATIEKSRDTIRAQKLPATTVNLRGGRYELKSTLLLDDRDSGTTYRAYKNEKPVISGGRRVTGWKQVPGKPYWEASVPVSAGFTDWFWQLYVNGVRAERARSNTTLKIAEFNKEGFTVQPDRLRAYTNVEDIRCLWVHVFKAGDIPVAGISSNSFKMQQPAWEIWNGWKDGATKTREFFVVNAFEELDEPGEWYLNRQTRALYYYPFKRDDMTTAEVYAPVVEGLVKVTGAHDLRIEGLTFEHGQWLDPQRKLLGRSQAEIYMGDTKTYSSELPGQIILDRVTNMVMNGCTVRHMGSCGVQVYEGCHRVTIEGNTCYDTTAAGITVGKFWMAQDQCPADTVSTDILVANNIVRDVGRDYPQGTGINIFAAQRCHVYHNDVSDTSYTGIHARIGDTGKVNPAIGQIEYKYNKVSHGFQDHKWGIDDGGHLYMHGRYPGSVVAENYSLHASRFINNEYYSDNWSHTVLWSKNISRYSKATRPYDAWHPGNVSVVFDGNYSDRPSPNTRNSK